MDSQEGYNELFDILANRRFVFWTCPNDCNGRIQWDKAGIIAECLECGLTNELVE